MSLANKSYAVTAEIQVPASRAEGVIVAVGGITGGRSLYAKNGKPKLRYNFFGVQLTYVEGATVMPPGRPQVRMEFKYDGGGLAKGGTVSLFVDGKRAGDGRFEQTEPFAFGEESLDVGHEAGSPVTTDYPPNRGAEFPGQVNCDGETVAGIESRRDLLGAVLQLGASRPMLIVKKQARSGPSAPSRSYLRYTE